MPLTPSGTRELLASLGHQPKRFLGQNFLVDGNIVRKSLELAEIKSGEAVVEIGPGLGTLTQALLAAGAEVWAVEKDRQLHAYLSENLVPQFPRFFHLQEGDALEMPLAGLGGTEAEPGYKIVANLPYAISTPWMDAVLCRPLPDRMVLMLQQEAAQRYSAAPGRKQFSAISIFLQAAFDVAPGHKVSASCFYPRPEIESYLLHLIRKTKPFIFRGEIKSLIRSCFQQRRKQLGAILRERAPEQAAGWIESLIAAGLSAKSRAEDVPIEVWMKFGTA